MKRVSGRNITHHFSFGERFDETMMKCYFVCYQHIMLPNHQLSLCFGLPKTACYPSRWLKRHFICALILLKLACVMPK